MKSLVADRVRLPGVEEAWKPGSSDQRNEALPLLRMFSMIDVGERAGGGMDKIFNGRAWVGYGELAYEVERDPDQTTLTLPLAAEFDENRQILSMIWLGSRHSCVAASRLVQRFVHWTNWSGRIGSDLSGPVVPASILGAEGPLLVGSPTRRRVGG